MKIRDFSKLYFALLILHLAVIYKPESQALYILSKPALLFSLLAFFIHRAKPVADVSKYWVILALLASLLADLFLMNPGNFFFLSGMSSFALAHIAYAGFYVSQNLKARGWVPLLASIFPLAALYLLYRGGTVPASVVPYFYGYLVLMGVHFVQSARFADTWKGLLRLPLAGAFLFVISHWLLLHWQYGQGGKYLQMGAVLTYAVAQYLIAIGLLRFFMRNEEEDSAP